MHYFTVFLSSLSFFSYQRNHISLHTRNDELFINYNYRGKGNLCFLLLRQSSYTIQAVLSKNDHINKAMLKFATAYVSFLNLLFCINFIVLVSPRNLLLMLREL